MTGQQSPDGNGSFAFFAAPQLNDVGTVLFSGGLSGTTGGTSDNSGLFRWSDGQSAAMVRKGDPIPGHSGEFVSFSNPVLNHNDSVSFFNNASPRGDPSINGVFQEDHGTIRLVVSRQQPVPGGNGTHDALGGLHAFNSGGALALRTGIRPLSGGLTSETGIFLSDENGLATIAREGQAVSDIPGAAFNEFGDPAINDSGVVAFFSSLTGTSGGANDDGGIFKGTPGSLQLLVQKGQAAPNGLGDFTTLTSVGLNESGQVAFRGVLTGGSSAAGYFVSDGGFLKTIAADGELSPDGGGAWSISQFGSARVLLNNSGQVFFGAFRADGARLFRSDGDQIKTIVRGNEPNPDGDGTLGTLFNSGAFNNRGQVAFLAGINGVSSSHDLGLFFYDDLLGLQLVARKGDELMGSTITAILFSDEHSHRDTEQTGLNNFGQVTYRFELADGRVGIALWAPVPEPCGMMVLMTGIAGLGGRTWRRPNRRR